MSQGQPRRPQGEAPQVPDRPIKYGDVFDVSGELADRPVAPRDAALAAVNREGRARPDVQGQARRGVLDARTSGHGGKVRITAPTDDADARHRHHFPI